MSAICVQRKHYLGCGDWDMCCRANARRLCYEDTPACDESAANPECTNASLTIGDFRCSRCGSVYREVDVRDTCPSCGEVITGAHWSEQKRWAGAR